MQGSKLISYACVSFSVEVINTFRIKFFTTVSHNNTNTQTKIIVSRGKMPRGYRCSTPLTTDKMWASKINPSTTNVEVPLSKSFSPQLLPWS